MGPFRRAGSRRRPAALRLGYALTGLILGAVWSLNRDAPVREQAARLLAFVIVVPPLVHRFQQRRRNRGREAAPHLSVFRAAAAKCALVAAAVPATMLLRPHTAAEDLVGGVGIAAPNRRRRPSAPGGFAGARRA
ncbi:hypothetical protein [Streptomyces sp. NPDC086787]|uniref:hypothetical protein n=1 Tax=Streptomyces sp. NPDC086787 TaxID=3365759 RepID=UPI0038093588